MEATVQVYLASASPRRRQLLAQIGVVFQSIAVTVDETPLLGEAPIDYVARLALAKARAGWTRATHGRDQALHDQISSTQAAPVLGADTSVVVDGEILGKPRDRSEGIAMLMRLSAREHQVLSAVAIVAGREAVRVQTSWVGMRPLSLSECQAYWDTGEPLDKAGGYAIQGRAAAFIAELRGSYSGVMGLPLFETVEMLKDYGVYIL